MNKKRNKGFTLVELLSIIIILSLVVTIVIITVSNVIKESKENSYKVTASNIEKIASSYAIENYTKHEWIDNETDNNKQYFCISVEDLIETVFLNNDVLKSYISDDQLVKKGDYIYLERDKQNKTITRNLLLNYYEQKYNNYCSDYNTGIDIEFIEEPSVWAKEKKLIINYKIFNLVNNISDYKYKYDFKNNNKYIDWITFDNLNKRETIDNITTNGVVKAYV